MSSGQPKVLVVDDDPAHLEIYGLLVKQAGFEPVPALVRFVGVDLPPEETVALVLLDYMLHSLKTSTELAKEIGRSYPMAPIIVLSDLWTLPADIAPFATEFVRKGQPARLLEAIYRLAPCPRAVAEPSGPVPE